MVSRHKKAAPTEKPAKKEAIQLDVPGFEVLERVGRGGMATVYRAQSVDASHDVILKVVSVDGDVVLRRFLRNLNWQRRWITPTSCRFMNADFRQSMRLFRWSFAQAET